MFYVCEVPTDLMSLNVVKYTYIYTKSQSTSLSPLPPSEFDSSFSFFQQTLRTCTTNNKRRYSIRSHVMAK